MTKDEALKMAIEAFVRWEDTYKSDCTEVINACKEVLEQPAQEPVAYMYSNEIIYSSKTVKNMINGKQELTPLYKKKEWQGLTDDEINDIIDDVFSKSTIEKNGVKTCSVREGVRAIEQALKEKNHGI